MHTLGLKEVLTSLDSAILAELLCKSTVAPVAPTSVAAVLTGNLDLENTALDAEENINFRAVWRDAMVALHKLL